MSIVSRSCRIAKRVLQLEGQEWTTMQAKLALQLANFHCKGGSDALMSMEAAWINLADISTLQWWNAWGTGMPQLQELAKKLVPLLIGSGPAERTWKDAGRVLTKDRNRTSAQRALDMVFVRTWLRRMVANKAQ